MLVLNPSSGKHLQKPLSRKLQDLAGREQRMISLTKAVYYGKILRMEKEIFLFG